MLRYALSRVALWCASLAGAALFASAIAALAVPETSSTGAFLATMLRELPGVVTFAPGVSAITNTPALAAVQPALVMTMQLLVGSMAIAILLGVALALMLTTPGTRRVAAGLLQFAGSVPIFCASLFIAALIAAFAPLPAVQDPTDLKFVTPLLLTIGLAGAGAVVLSLSRSLSVATGEPYGEGLARLGLSQGEILRGYVARQAAAIALKDSGNIVLALFSAAAVVEWVFAWPGAGAAFIRSVALGDWNVVALLIMLIGAVRFTLDLAGAMASFALLGEEPPP